MFRTIWHGKQLLSLAVFILAVGWLLYILGVPMLVTSLISFCLVVVVQALWPPR